MADTMLEARDLKRHFDVSRPWLQRMLAREGRRILRAVDGISFAIPKGGTLSLVGDPAAASPPCAAVGRPVSAERRQRAFRRPRPHEARAMADQRRRMQMIFLGPYASLNPRWRVRDIVAEPIRAFGLVPSRAAQLDRVAEC